MNRTVDRRAFLQTGIVAGSGLAGSIGFCSVGMAKSPNERLSIAAVGTANRAAADIAGVAGENIVALCDVDASYLDRAGAKYRGARKYRDFRVMLEKDAEKIDAVVIGTPDHTHAPAAAMALRLGKHVYCEKPLTHTVLEARTLAELARKGKLVTQLGTQIHAGDNYRRVVELVRSGIIGAVHEAHVWVGVSYGGARFTTGTPVPKHLDWDLWLGPAPARPYSEGVHPARWRRFWDYGTGGLGDFGCHYLDLVHWALELRHPTTIEASGPPVDPVATPAWLEVRYEYPARGAAPPVKVTWYDGGRRPRILDGLRDRHGKPLEWRSGQLFVGERGMIVSDYSRHLLLPLEKFADSQRPKPSIPSSIGHHLEWVHAIKTGGTTTCSFDYSGALTEAVLLGNVAYRAGTKIHWDAANLKVTNSPQAQQYLHTEYRKGWTL